MLRGVITREHKSHISLKLIRTQLARRIQCKSPSKVLGDPEASREIANVEVPRRCRGLEAFKCPNETGVVGLKVASLDEFSHTGVHSVSCGLNVDLSLDLTFFFKFRHQLPLLLLLQRGGLHREIAELTATLDDAVQAPIGDGELRYARRWHIEGHIAILEGLCLILEKFL